MGNVGFWMDCDYDGNQRRQSDHDKSSIADENQRNIWLNSTRNQSNIGKMKDTFDKIQQGEMLVLNGLWLWWESNETNWSWQEFHSWWKSKEHLIKYNKKSWEMLVLNEM